MAGNRRDFLKACVATAVAASGRGRVSKAEGLGDSPAPLVSGATRLSAKLDRFVDPLPILQKLRPRNRQGHADQYTIRMMEFSKRLHSQLPPTKLWGYEGQYPGPTLEAMRDRPVQILWENHLPKKHLFQVDERIHGAMRPTPLVRTVPHLHGSRTSSESDGLPEKWFTPGQSVTYDYPNGQRAAPLWYHDHPVGSTRLNVYAGLSGFYLLRDQRELQLGLPSGDYEVPIVLQDRTLDEHGQLLYVPTFEDGKPLAAGEWGSMFYGELPVLNGAIYPYMDVEPRKYRFRFLNGSNARFYNLYFNPAQRPTDIPGLIPFHQVGSDQGLLASPAEMSKLLIAPGERMDLVVDFAGHAGKVVTLSNDATAPYPGWTIMHDQYAALSELLQFRVKLPIVSSEKAYSFAAQQAEVVRTDPKDAVITRDFVITEQMDANGRSLGVRINDKGYDDPVSESPKLGTVEKWRFINTTDDAHPMHLHLVQFQILERQGFNLGTFETNKLEFVGAPRKPAANEAGWKDTAVVNPGDVLSILIKFEGFTGRYVYHCHMLEHEDNDMMRPFEVMAAD